MGERLNPKEAAESGNSFKERVMAKFGYTAADLGEEEAPAEENTPGVASALPEDESTEEAPAVEAASEETPPAGTPAPALDPNTAAMIEQNKRLSEMVETLMKQQAAGAAPEKAATVGLTEAELMDPEVRKDPAKFAAAINRAAESIASRQVESIRVQQEMANFQTEFYQRPENKRFAALRGTAMDPLNLAATQAVSEDPSLRSATKARKMEELTKRVAIIGAQLDQFAGKPAAPAAKKKPNQPGAAVGVGRPSAGEESINGTRKDPDRTRAGVRELLGR